MFTKQVSRPVDSLDPPSWPPRLRRVERTRRKTWSRARSDVLVPLQGGRRYSGSGWELEQWLTEKVVDQARVLGVTSVAAPPFFT